MLLPMLLDTEALNSLKAAFVCPWDAWASHRSLLHHRANGTLYSAGAISSGLACLFSTCPVHSAAYRYVIRWPDLQCRMKMNEKNKKPKQKKNHDMEISVLWKIIVISKGKNKI